MSERWIAVNNDQGELLVTDGKVKFSEPCEDSCSLASDLPEKLLISDAYSIYEITDTGINVSHIQV